MKRFSKKSFNKSVYVLGLNEALGASAALLKDGEIVAAAQEERFTRIKNHWGYPKTAIQFCCERAGITSRNIDLVVLSYKDPYPHFTTGRAVELPNTAPNFLGKLRDVAPILEYKFPPFKLLTDFGRNVYYRFIEPRNKSRQVMEIAGVLQLEPEKIIRVNHHLCHAYTAYFANPNKGNPQLVLTCDGAGDKLCASVYVVNDEKFQQISVTPHTSSLGLFYASVTAFLGMKAHEDEYKVMGLAPYGKAVDITKILSIFESLLWVDGLQFSSSFHSRHFDYYLEGQLKRFRFDQVAAAAQVYLENMLVTWVKNAINQTGIRELAVAGGVFLNVKANQKIAQLIEVKHIYFTPSPGDDSNCIGACYYGIRQLQPETKPQPLTSLYLGPQYNDLDTYNNFKRNKIYKNYQITKPANIAKKVAQLLANGAVVARFAGRMEFGARALGNRSILANPRNRDVVERLNRLIKMRDFWMPFAPTILAQDADKYLKNPQKISAPYMIVTFATTELGKNDLAAAIHPYDKTVRPQTLERYINPAFYDLISEFKKLTGVGAILNTSFNLHGDPIVATPAAALATFARSQLKILVMENLLIIK